MGGLSLPAYMHFTSPIRRYADVLVHRRLAHIIGHESHESAVGSTTAAGASDHDNFLERLKEAVVNCNKKKRDAQDAQIDGVQVALTDHVRRNGGLDVEDAVITRMVVPEKGEPGGAPPAE